MARTSDGVIRIPSPTDGIIFDFFDKLSPQRPLSISQLGYAIPNGREYLKNISSDQWRHSRTISQITAQIADSGSLSFSRSVIETPVNGIQVISPSEFEAELWIDWQTHTGQIGADLLNQVIAEIDELRGKLAVSPDLPASTELMRIHGRQIAGLSELHTKVIRDAEEERHQRNSQFDEKERQLEERAIAARAQDEQKLAAAERALLEKSVALDTREKALDDRAYTHARRQMRSEITSALKTRLQEPIVSDSTSLQRRQILAVCVALLGIFATIVFVTSLELYLQTSRAAIGVTQLLILTGRVAVAVAAFAGVAFYLLSWLRQVHDSDLRSERDLERYRYDLDRASWAIETILEADAKAGEREASPVPDRWVEGVTHGLFARTEAREEPGLEALGSLLNFAAEAELGPTGTKLRLTKGGLKGLRKSNKSGTGEQG